LDRFERPDAWGLLPAKQLTPPAVKAGRDALADTPGMANQMLSVGRTLYSWAIPLGYVNSNPFEHVGPLDIPDRRHVPWQRWTLDAVLANAPEDLRRMVRLILLCHKFRLWLRGKRRMQHWHRCRVVAIATASRRWTVAIELGTWRCGRIGGAAGSITTGNGRFFDASGGMWS